MEICLSTTLPSKYADMPPLETYETRFIYIGLSRFDVHKKRLSKMITHSKTHICYTESFVAFPVFTRGYHTEMATVRVYSESPRVWSEELSPGEIHFFFQQQPTQVTTTA